MSAEPFRPDVKTTVCHLVRTTGSCRARVTDQEPLVASIGIGDVDGRVQLAEAGISDHVRVGRRCLRHDRQTHDAGKAEASIIRIRNAPQSVLAGMEIHAYQ